MTDALVRAIRTNLAAASDPVRAAGQQRYMKSAMPCRGVAAPEQRRLVKDALAVHPLESFDDWRDAVLALWREAEFREERYAAILVAEAPRHRAWARRLEALSIYEEVIVDGAWWDFVDSVAAHLVGGLLREHPQELRPLLLDWACGDDIWLRRTAILAQLGFKEETDRELLFAAIEPSLGEQEFFLRKAIGWALRQYARVAPDEVRAYVRAHEVELSPLSRREALKHL